MTMWNVQNVVVRATIRAQIGYFGWKIFRIARQGRDLQEAAEYGSSTHRQRLEHDHCCIVVGFQIAIWRVPGPVSKATMSSQPHALGSPMTGITMVPLRCDDAD